jgi:hypothetical protein
VSNQRKDEIVSDKFSICSFQGCHGEILPRDRSMPKGLVYLEFSIQQPSHGLTIVTHKSLTVWSRKMDHQKAERVVYQICIQNFQSFGLA